jgi:hypothetical protein
MRYHILVGIGQPIRTPLLQCRAGLALGELSIGRATSRIVQGNSFFALAIVPVRSGYPVAWAMERPDACVGLTRLDLIA